MLLALLAFIAGFSFDFAWTYCVKFVSDKKPFAAANMSILICIVAAVSTIVIIEKNLLAFITYAIGSWVGTYLAVNGKK